MPSSREGRPKERGVPGRRASTRTTPSRAPRKRAVTPSAGMAEGEAAARGAGASSSKAPAAMKTALTDSAAASPESRAMRTVRLTLRLELDRLLRPGRAALPVPLLGAVAVARSPVTLVLYRRGLD